MSLHIFSEIYLHFTWHTHENRSFLTGNVERWVHDYLKNRCRTTRGVFFHDTGGTDDHIHLSLRIEPQVTISELVQELKGASSHDANEHFNRKVLAWQRGYGVVSFGRRNPPWVAEYIRRQRLHHANGTTQERLERINAIEGVAREESADYGCPI
ncbi:MAG TPA: IS200/IS605 family transposase [Planctomycetota bacterium]|nr:IS200/IS605 family transposase [Planctomycetota bacterium]